jgi:tetratricopeptide (TPR) repeat protein
MFLGRNGGDSKDLILESIADCDLALKGDPDFPPTLMAAAIAQTALADWKIERNQDGEEELAGAIHLLGRLLEINPKSAEALLRRGNAWLRRGQSAQLIREEDPTRAIEEALSDFSRLIEIDPTLAEPHWRRGRCLALLDRWEEACEEFQRAAQLDPSQIPQFKALWDAAKNRP